MHFLRAIVLLFAVLATAHAADRPNILVIMADDIGPTNVSAYSQGLMGQTPNIDRIAHEGMLFTDHYSEPSCTPGRAAFITGQYPIRIGLTTVGLPNSPVGIDKHDPTLAEALKPLGYVSGQFGKNHLGDRDLLLIQAAYQRQAGDTRGAELTLARLAAINPHDPALGQRHQETKP